jgi:uncharacterized membrane protein YqaE (UPF0057 family)
MSDITYGKKCKIDSDCDSNICETKYDNLGNSEGRYCISKNKDYGRECETNNDCASGECLYIYDENQHLKNKRCKVSDVKIEEDTKSDLFFNNDVMKYGIVNDDYRLLEFQNSKAGPIAKFITYFMETIVSIVKLIIMGIINLFFNIVKSVIKAMTSKIKGDIFFGAITNKHRKTGTCFNMWLPRTILTILLPPFGVFMSRGLRGIKYIIISSILTLCFYFPGLIYSFIVMNNSKISEDEYKYTKCSKD